MSSLVDMPDVVMEEILKNCDLRSIMSLRKVCLNLRNFIDDVKPDCHLHTVEVKVTTKSVLLCFTSSSRSSTVINYTNTENGCIVRARRKSKILHNLDYTAAFFTDFELISRHLKQTLDCFHVDWSDPSHMDEEEKPDRINCFFDRFKVLLEKYQFPVKKIKLEIKNRDLVMSVLPFVNAKKLQKIEILDPFGDPEPLSLTEIGKLEQWKKAKEFIVFNLPVLADIQSFSHFTKCEIRLESISSADLVHLKDNFSKSASFLEFKIHFERFQDLDQLEQSWGPAFCELDQKDLDRNWYFFRTLDNNTVLSLFLDSFQLSFSTLNTLFLPPNRYVLN
ncbi:unnamed protein product [Caenorhabditis brenneri]